jgi:hypothetical protein
MVRIRRQVFHTIYDAKADLFDYVEMSFHPRLRHIHIAHVSPEAIEGVSGTN